MSCAYLYLDADRFFAHVELWLRDLDPDTLLAVTAADEPPVRGGHGIIAASSSARRAGVERGMKVRDARQLCPRLRCVPQRPDQYVRAHRLMVRAVDTVIPVERVCSVDEVLCRLDRRDVARTLMDEVKRAVAGVFGRTLTVSLGVAPTPLLAKMAAESNKPDGAVYWPAGSLPYPLLALDPSDVPGLGPARVERLAAAGLGTMADLWAVHPHRIRQALGTVEGGRIGYALHGVDVPWPRGPRRSMSVSRVLVPGEREPDVVYGLARALVMVLMARARRERVVVAVMHLACGALRLALPVGERMAYRPVLHRLARGWPAAADFSPGYSVQVTADLDTGARSAALEFCSGPDPERTLSDLIDAAHGRFGAAALDLGRVLRRRWMGRKIAFESVPR